MDNSQKVQKYTLFVLACLITTSLAAGPRCYKSTNVPSPRDCATITQCSDGEVCYLEKAQGLVQNDVYNLGCMPDNATCSKQNALIGRRDRLNAHAHAIENRITRRASSSACKECCVGNYCNMHSGLCGTVVSINRRCCQCTDVSDPSHYDQITECQQGYVCAVIEQTMSSAADHISCAKCCNDRDLCNGDLCSSSNGTR